VFLATLGLGHWAIIVGLAVVAVPLGGWLVRRVRPRPMLRFVGLLVIAPRAAHLLQQFGAI
jgi:hypothetical protein